MTAPRAFVTGGSGVVGRALVAHLTSEGREVVALARSDASADALAAMGVRVARGDVTDPRSFDAALRGCGVVFHVAGVNEFCGRDPARMFDVNVRGSLEVVRAAARAGIGRVVYTSSAATLGEEAGTTGREDSPHRGWFLSDYERSKFEAERAVLAEGARRDVDVVAVNPSSVQGPGRAGGTGRILVLYLRGKLKAFVRTRISLVDVDDCARGHALAEARGAPGERYVLNGATLPVEDALAIVARVTGVHHRPRLVPGRVALAAATAVEGAARVRGRTPSVCRATVRTMLHGHAYDGSRATRALGLAYTPVEDTLRRTVEWLVAHGHVPAHGSRRAA